MGLRDFVLGGFVDNMPMLQRQSVAPPHRSKRTVAQDKRASAKNKARRRARKLGHA